MTCAQTAAGRVEHEIICYLNLDVAVAGDALDLSADPLLEPLLLDAMKNVSEPYGDAEGQTLYSVWKQREFPDANDSAAHVRLLGSGSDFVPFYHHFGVSAVTGGIVGEYGTYHSVYDSLVYMQLVDPQWRRTQAMAQLFALVMLEMATRDIIAFAAGNLHSAMVRWTDELDAVASDFECDWRTRAPAAKPALLASVDAFGHSARVFQAAVAAVSAEDEDYDESVARFNEALKALPRQFIIAEGLPGRKYYKNILVAPDILSGYSAYPFPYIAYSFQFNCTASYLEETVQRTVAVIDEATAFIENYI